MKTLFFRTTRQCRAEGLPTSGIDAILDDSKRIALVCDDDHYNVFLTKEETLRFYEQLKEGLGL